MDSRSYKFLFPIKTPGDIPPDFDSHVRAQTFEAGVFLPQDDPDWFGRLDYPARILLLQEDGLFVASHPTAGEQPIYIALSELQELEMGRILLLGWLTFRFGKSICHLPYNTRASTPMEELMTQLRHKWLIRHASTLQNSEQDFGEALDIKFRNMRLRELDKEEEILLQFFEASREILTRFLFFRLQNWKAGDLVALTPNCVVWITDRYQGRREFCGGVAHYAPLSALRGITFPGPSSSPTMDLSFANSVTWTIPVYEDLVPSAEQFTRAVRNALRVPAA